MMPKQKHLRDIGFGSVLTHQKDGIARGTGAFVTLANQPDNLVLLKDKASAHYSFNRGTSRPKLSKLYDGYDRLAASDLSGCTMV